TITRLGQGVDQRRTLAPDALDRTLRTIADYAATCGELGVQKLRVTGTSAVRDAHNREEFFDGVRKLTGTEAELLSGEEEAQATFLGTLSDLSEDGPVMVVDIGGGSTEFIVGQQVPERLVSLNFGCVRMHEKHLHSDPPTGSEIDALRDEVMGQLIEARKDLNMPPGARIIGVAGTATQLATLKSGLPVYDPDVTHHLVLSHGDVRLLAKRLKSLTYLQRKEIPALEPGRADVIVAGAEILLCVLEAFDAAEILVSEKDILDGLVIQLLDD
ncbi:MAG: Ppx/GppA family phosphatase, partial [Actinobacteria bacterium]|nr:Ppx/GppA family phosphatase [Actinomycetota bacterium]